VAGLLNAMSCQYDVDGWIAQNKSLMHLYYTMEINVLLIPTGHSAYKREL